MTVASVMFHIRRPAGNKRWWYQRVECSSPSVPWLNMASPPLVGDLITLYDRNITLKGGPVFRVVERQWSYPVYGSANWPYGKSEPDRAILDIVVKPASHIYRDETDMCLESSCEAVWMNGGWWLPDGADDPDPHTHAPYRRDQTSA